MEELKNISWNCKRYYKTDFETKKIKAETLTLLFLAKGKLYLRYLRLRKKYFTLTEVAFSVDKTCLFNNFLIISISSGKYVKGLLTPHNSHQKVEKKCAIVWHTLYYTTSIAVELLSLPLWYRNSVKEWKIRIAKGEDVFFCKQFQINSSVL